jgi:hypothetical protein
VPVTWCFLWCSVRSDLAGPCSMTIRIPARREAFLRLLRKGVSVSAAAQAIGVSRVATSAQTRALQSQADCRSWWRSRQPTHRHRSADPTLWPGLHPARQSPRPYPATHATTTRFHPSAPRDRDRGNRGTNTK